MKEALHIKAVDKCVQEALHIKAVDKGVQEAVIATVLLAAMG